MVINDKYIGLVAAVTGATLWYLALHLPDIPTHGDVGPAFFPKIIAALLIACAAFFVLQGIRAGKPKQCGGLGLDVSTAAKIVALLAITALYVAVMEPVGFVVSTFAYLVAGGYVFGDRRWLLLCITSTACTVVLYAIFKMWLKVPLPTWNAFMALLSDNF